MDIKEYIPEYLLKEYKDVSSPNFIENYEPNIITISAGILEYLFKKNPNINTWSDENFENYIKEFKIDEVFSQPDLIYSMRNPKLLEGFFKFKGTKLDINFLSKLWKDYFLNINSVENQFISSITDLNREELSSEDCLLSIDSFMKLEANTINDMLDSGNFEEIILYMLQSRLSSCVNYNIKPFILNTSDSYDFLLDDSNLSTTVKENAEDKLCYEEIYPIKYGGVPNYYSKDTNFKYSKNTDLKYLKTGKVPVKYSKNTIYKYTKGRGIFEDTLKIKVLS